MFGMGTGGSLRLLSPEIWGCLVGPLRFAPLSIRSAFASLASHPQNRTGRSALLGLTMALRRFASTFPLPLWLRLRFRFSQITPGQVSGWVPALPLLPLLLSLQLLLRPCLLPLPSTCSLTLQDQALDRLVSPSSIRYRTSTDDLSTLSSSRGLTHF